MFNYFITFAVLVCYFITIYAITTSFANYIKQKYNADIEKLHDFYKNKISGMCVSYNDVIEEWKKLYNDEKEQRKRLEEDKENKDTSDISDLFKEEDIQNNI